MKHLKKQFLIILCIGLLCSTIACSKASNGGSDTSNNPLKNLPGTIYYSWSDEGVYQYNFAGQKRQPLLADNTSRNSWDISRDQNYILECLDAAGDYDASLFTITQKSDGKVYKQFKYYATEGDIAIGALSPDGQKIAMQPTFNDGIVITDLSGNIIQKIQTVNNEKITEKPAWMPDNTLIFQFKQLLLRTNQSYDNVSTLKTMQDASWNTPIASKDGKKVAFVQSGHIWLLTLDGGALKQVTQSSAEELPLDFSPDGKYLLIGTDYHTTGPFGKMFYLKIIPTDGQLYQVNDNEASAGVIPVTAPGGNKIEPANSKAIWR